MSSFETVIAFVLHKRDQGEYSQIIKFFTQELGVINTSYLAARRPKKQANLQLFTPLCVQLSVKGDWYYVKEVDMLAPTPQFKTMQLWSAYYLNELLDIAIRPHDLHIGLFKHYAVTLSNLASSISTQDIEIVLRRFEIDFLKACGSLFSLPEEINPNAYYQFQPDEGFTLYKQTSLMPHGYLGETLLAWQNEDWLATGTLATAKSVMRQAIQHVLLDKPLKVRALMKEL